MHRSLPEGSLLRLRIKAGQNMEKGANLRAAKFTPREV